MEINANYRYVDNKAAFSVEPIFGSDAVAIMLATSNDYAPYASVMIQSIKENADKDRNYDIVVVGNLFDSIKKPLEGMVEKNIAIRVVDINPLLDNIDLFILSTKHHFTVETYYRFFIPQLFHQYEKVLYLDVDMVVFRDVAELFDTDMGDNWWAVTRERCIDILGFIPDTWVEKELFPYLKKTLKMDSVFDYFQGGVMIWNVRQCIKDRVHEQLIDRLSEIKTPKVMDQCVMSSLANGRHLHWLHGKWNATWCIFLWTEGSETTAYKEVMHHLDDPYIIHFNSYIKPWDEPNRPNANKFWPYARKTPFYETILLNMLFHKIAKDGICGTEGAHAQEIKKYKSKVKKYQILQTLTFGMIKSFRRRRKYYQDKIKQLSEHQAASKHSSFLRKLKKTNRAIMRPLERFLKKTNRMVFRPLENLVRFLRGKPMKPAHTVNVGTNPLEEMVMNHSVETATDRQNQELSEHVDLQDQSTQDSMCSEKKSA